MQAAHRVRPGGEVIFSSLAIVVFVVIIEDVEDVYIGSDLLPILLPTRDCALEAAIEASLWCRDQL